MYNVNIQIISELKNFITKVSNSRNLLQCFCASDKDFIRQRKLPFARLVLLIVKLCKKTLSVELEQFFEELTDACPCSVSAFVQQRLKLKPLFFQLWNLVLCRSYYLYAGVNVKRWKGYRVVAADGSSVSLVNTKALGDYFGGQSNQLTNFVLAGTFYYYDVLNELILYSRIEAYRYGELNMAYDAVGEIRQDMLMIYDRYYCGYKTMALHLWHKRERKFIIRAKEKIKIIKAFIASGQRSRVVYWQTTPSARQGMKKSGYRVGKGDQLKVRLVRVELAESVEVLITNLWEEEGHSPEQFKDLYFLRWGVETNICQQKNILQLESFSGLGVTSVLQDFYATVMVANLHSVLIKDAQQIVDGQENEKMYPVKINKNKSFGKLKSYIVFLFINEDVQTILLKLNAYFVKNLVPVRKGRSFTRMRKNQQSKSKYKTFPNFKPAY